MKKLLLATLVSIVLFTSNVGFAATDYEAGYTAGYDAGCYAGYYGETIKNSTSKYHSSSYIDGYEDGFADGYISAMEEDELGEEEYSYADYYSSNELVLKVSAHSVNARSKPGMDAPSKKILHKGECITAISISFIEEDGKCWIGADIDGETLYVSLKYLEPVKDSKMYAEDILGYKNINSSQVIIRYMDEWVSVEEVCQDDCGNWFVKTSDAAWVYMKDLSL